MNQQANALCGVRDGWGAFAPWGVAVSTPTVRADAATVAVAVAVVNEAAADAHAVTVRVRLTLPSGADGPEAVAPAQLVRGGGSTANYSVTLTLPRPALWGPESPLLHNARVTVDDEGDVGVCGTRGDLVAIIRVEDDDRFMRRGADLILKSPLKVSLRDALGGTVDVAAPTLDATVRIRTSPGIVVAPGRFYASEGLGLPATGGYLRGRLVVRFDVEFPARLSEAQAVNVAKALDGDPGAVTDGGSAARRTPSRCVRSTRTAGGTARRGGAGSTRS